MKILYLCEESNLKNGWAVVAYHTIRIAAEQGIEVDVLTSRDAQNLPIKGVNYFPLLPEMDRKALKHPLNFFKSFIQSLRIINSNDYSLVHLLVETYLPLLLFTQTKRNYLTVHGTYAVNLFSQSRLKSLYIFTLQKIATVFCVSHFTANIFQDITGFARVHVTNPGVDFNFFNQKKITHSFVRSPYFSLIGQLKERKGVLLAIKAIEILKIKFPEIKLLIAGKANNSYALECQRYVNEHGLSDHVSFLGFVTEDELIKLYSTCIGNLLPSLNTKGGSFEGYGLIHLEANSMGLPSIGSRNCGNEDSIQDGISGYLVEQGNIDEIANKMETLMTLFLSNKFTAISQQCQTYAQSKTWNMYFSRIKSKYPLA